MNCLDSAQIIYDDDQKTLLTNAVTGNALAFEGKSANLQTPTDINSIVSWS